jgi:hypothetical protein
MTTLIMIQNIPQRVVKMSNPSSQLLSSFFRRLSTRSSLRPLASTRSTYLQNRFYASPAPSNSKQIPKQADLHASRDGKATDPDIVVEYDAFDDPIVLERDRTTRARTRDYRRLFTYTGFFVGGVVLGNLLGNIMAPSRSNSSKQPN